MLTTYAAAGAVALAFVGGSASAPIERTAPDKPDKPGYTVASSNGTGCPRGPVTVSPLPDAAGFTLRFPSFTAKNGGGAAATESRRSCQIAVGVSYPKGFAFTVSKIEQRGAVKLSDGGNATATTAVGFAGKPGKTTATKSFTGPRNGSWVQKDQVKQDWSACGNSRLLTVRVEGRVKAGRDNASTLTLGSAGNGVDAVYQLAWRRC